MLKDDDHPISPAVLTSWKEIAQHLGKGVRTVQRWEQRFGLPVRRPRGGGHKSTVLARRSDLDQWVNSSWGRRGLIDTAAAGQQFQPMLDRLGTAVAMSKTLQSNYSILLQEMSESLNSLLANCRELSNRRRETAELITTLIDTRSGVRCPPTPQEGMGEHE